MLLSFVPSFGRALFLTGKSIFIIYSSIYHLSFKFLHGIFGPTEHCFSTFPTQSINTEDTGVNGQAASPEAPVTPSTMQHPPPGGCPHLGTPVIHSYHIICQTLGWKDKVICNMINCLTEAITGGSLVGECGLILTGPCACGCACPSPTGRGPAGPHLSSSWA